MWIELVRRESESFLKLAHYFPSLRTRANSYCYLNTSVEDADALAHQVYEPGSQSWKDIVSEFGEGILSQANNDTDASIDRTKLGSIVFGDNMAMSVSASIMSYCLCRMALRSRSLFFSLFRD